MTDPLLSVVLTVVEGKDATAECLDALAHQVEAPAMEVLVPYDDGIAAVAELGDRFADVRFVAMGAVATERDPSTAAGQHELFDRRRAAGLREARGDLVAILEDRGVPRPDWAAAAARLHRELPHAVIGGAVENGVDRLLSWAVYFCDFSRYQLPLEAGSAEWVTDVDVCYKRAALQATEEQWRTRYHETTVHWELQRRGETLFLAPDMVVEQRRRSLTLSRVLAERFHWGRLFAYTRARECGAARRVMYALASPVLPLLLLARHLRTQIRKRARLAVFLRASPAVALLLVAWSLGELVGHASGRP